MPEDTSTSGSPIAARDKAPETDEEIVGMVDDTFDYLKRSRIGLEQRIKEARHFLAGDQWIRYLPHSRKFSRHVLSEYVPTPVTNYLATAYDRLLDLFLSGNMLPVVDPATQDQEDVDAARAHERALQSEFIRLKTLTKTYTPAAGWLILAGNSFIGAHWNGKAGRQISKPLTRLTDRPIIQEVIECADCGAVYAPDMVPPQGCTTCGSTNLQKAQVHGLDTYGGPGFETIEEPELDKEGTPKKRNIKVGDIEEHVVNVLNFYPMAAESFDRSRHCIEVDPMSLDEVRHLFGTKAEKVVAEHLEIDEHLNSTENVWQSHDPHGHANDRDHTLVKFFRAVPEKRWPKGLFLIIASGQVLYQGDLDSVDGKLPYTHLKYRDIPGSFWGASPFTDMIPQQKRINAVDSHVVQNRKQMLSNQWLVPRGASISHIDGRPGLMIRYDPAGAGGYKPERLQGVPVPQQVIQERQQTISDLYEVGGPTEEMAGKLSSGPETGPAVELVQEAATKRFGPIILGWRVGLSEHEHRKGQLIGKYWKESRLVRILGENRDMESYYLSRADMRQGVDMTVRVNETIEFSQAVKKQRLMEAAKNGLLGDIRQPNIRGKILEKMGIEGFEAEYILDAKKARRVIRKLRDGEEVLPPTPFENHGVQFAIIREFLLTIEFEKLDPTRQQSVLQRAQIHQQFMQQEQQKMMQAAQAAKGTGDQVSGAIADSGALGQEPVTQTQGA